MRSIFSISYLSENFLQRRMTSSWSETEAGIRCPRTKTRTWQSRPPRRTGRPKPTRRTTLTASTCQTTTRSRCRRLCRRQGCRRRRCRRRCRRLHLLRWRSNASTSTDSGRKRANSLFRQKLYKVVQRLLLFVRFFLMNLKHSSQLLPPMLWRQTLRLLNFVFDNQSLSSSLSKTLICKTFSWGRKTFLRHQRIIAVGYHYCKLSLDPCLCYTSY